MLKNTQTTGFTGYSKPNYTMVPDELFDEQLPDLSGAELKVLLYIIRRTFGFMKDADNISINQMLHGIKTKDGRPLDRGTGLSKKTLLLALRTLEQKNIIISERHQSIGRGDEPTNYRLNIRGYRAMEITTPPVGEKLPQGGGGKITPPPWGKNYPSQQTVLQETVKQKTGVVVVNAALENFGVSKNVAEQLAKAYPEEYLLEKLELVEWLVNTKSPLVSKNPAGYLRQAIEDDYKPPRKYKSSKQRSEEEEATHRRDKAEHQIHIAAEEEYKRLRAEAKQRMLEEHPPEPIRGTDLTTESAWNKALSSLQKQVPAATYATWLKDTLLLKLEEDTAFVLVTSQFAREWLERRLYRSISRTLEEVLGQAVEVEFLVSQPAMDPT